MINYSAKDYKFQIYKKGKDTSLKSSWVKDTCILVLMIDALCHLDSRFYDHSKNVADTPKVKTTVAFIKARNIAVKNREEKISVVEDLRLIMQQAMKVQE